MLGIFLLFQVNVNTLQSSDLRDCLVKKNNYIHQASQGKGKKNGSDIAANENEKPAVNTYT